MTATRYAALVAAFTLALGSNPATAGDFGELDFQPEEPRPGDIVRVVTQMPPRVIGGSISVGGRTFPGFIVGGLFTAYVGLDLDLEPGEHEVGYQLGPIVGTGKLNVVSREFGKESLTVAPNYTDLDAETLERVNKESARLKAIWKKITPQRLWTKSFLKPAVGPAGSPFGLRRIFNGQPRSPHSGIDIKASSGSEVYASNSGIVALADDLFFTGNTVIIDHGLGLYTIYAHLSKMNVSEGDQVQRAQVVGLVGATGRVTGAHLHWAVKLGGARVDPLGLPGLLF